MPVGNDDLYTINYNYYMINKSKWIPQLSLAAANKPGLNNVLGVTEIQKLLQSIPKPSSHKDRY